MIIPDGWFQGKKAELGTNEAGDWVQIDQETQFFVKDGRYYLSIEDIDHIEEYRNIYNLLREKA